jgi:hypothetical protein
MRESSIRPVVRHACATLNELSRMFSTGRITRDRWYCEVRDVIGAVEASLGPAPEDGAALAAATAPGEADPAQPEAVKLSARLLDTYAADGHSVKGHTA